MKRKLNSILNVVLLVVVCLAIFSGCTTEKVDPWEVDESLNLVGKLVKAMHGWIGSYGWTVVLFTVFLKILFIIINPFIYSFSVVLIVRMFEKCINSSDIFLFHLTAVIDIIDNLVHQIILFFNDCTET